MAGFVLSLGYAAERGVLCAADFDSQFELSVLRQFGILFSEMPRTNRHMAVPLRRLGVDTALEKTQALRLRPPTAHDCRNLRALLLAWHTDATALHDWSQACMPSLEPDFDDDSTENDDDDSRAKANERSRPVREAWLDGRTEILPPTGLLLRLPLFETHEGDTLIALAPSSSGVFCESCFVEMAKTSTNIKSLTDLVSAAIIRHLQSLVSEC